MKLTIRESKEVYVIKKDGKYVQDLTDGEKLTKTYDKAEKFLNKKSAEIASRDYGRRYGKGYTVVKIF